jgi:myo-inositol 2-dehydrogenase/D-chiro-inositol 1-dehydrogenase
MKRIPWSGSRRGFLKAAAAGVGPLILPGRVLGLNGAAPPSEIISLGFIGVGVHGLGYNLQTFLQEADARAVAVCDVFASRREKAKAVVDAKYGDAGCWTFADFRELLAAPGIDAVCISTPDHWHVPLSLLALDAGKDVMCEKPTLTIAEGRELVNRVAERKAVFQFGIEDRSVIQYHKIAEWARSGTIGTLRKIEVQLPSGAVPPKEEPIPVPADLNYRMWLGPAPFHPYTATRTDAMVWRQIRDYSGGMLADWGAHLIDTAQVANSAEDSGPVEVSGTGKVPLNSQATMPTEFDLTYRYANGVEMHVTSGGVRLRVIGDKGWVGNTGWRGRLEASSDEILKTKLDPGQSKIWPLPKGEHRNFLDAVRSRQPTTYTAEAGHRLSTVMHIGSLAMQLGRKLRWDPAAETFADDAEANALRTRVASEDWKNA